MAENSVTQMQLAKDPGFLKRVEYILVSQAVVVLGETGIGATHAARASYAKSVIAAPAGQAVTASTMIAGSTNLIPPNAITTVNPDGTVTTNCTDASMLSQVATLWNRLSGIDSGS